MQQQIKEYGHFLRTALLWYVTERVVKSLTVVSDSADPAANEEASVGGDARYEMLGLGLRGPNPALSAARCRGLPTGGGRARCRAGGGGAAPSASSRFLLAPTQPVPVAAAESSLQFPRHSQTQLPGAPRRHQHPLSSTYSSEIGVPATRWNRTLLTSVKDPGHFLATLQWRKLYLVTVQESADNNIWEFSQHMSRRSSTHQTEDPANSACPISPGALVAIKKIMNFTGSSTPGGTDRWQLLEMIGVTMEIDKEDEQVILSGRSGSFT
ncbi:uncharacterized protein LOC132490531 [Mesoplodon densirostris]|uniref:uncharacterized protein LOC132490531 n=1 Tax=Mesoplodon densirostris TaxID=48708 RepID=UPI0028DCAA75|nr:uncharacterized protein LOC132490531 [Mesoplodon densirostris]